MTRAIKAFAILNKKTGKLEKNIPIHFKKDDARLEMYCNGACYPIKDYEVVKILISFK